MGKSNTRPKESLWGFLGKKKTMKDILAELRDEELMKRNGMYAKLFRLQVKGYK
ncbi:MAG: hypothetical protein HY363_00485 [Candidatus Aenigmarchaeota archaeon]|nr:hypothetical protein [Candidatus Aenigmarchaeota archaeon]